MENAKVPESDKAKLSTWATSNHFFSPKYGPRAISFEEGLIPWSRLILFI